MKDYLMGDALSLNEVLSTEVSEEVVTALGNNLF
jgi:hypothetical protein